MVSTECEPITAVWAEPPDGPGVDPLVKGSSVEAPRSRKSKAGFFFLAFAYLKSWPICPTPKTCLFFCETKKIVGRLGAIKVWGHAP